MDVTISDKRPQYARQSRGRKQITLCGKSCGVYLLSESLRKREAQNLMFVHHTELSGFLAICQLVKMNVVSQYTNVLRLIILYIFYIYNYKKLSTKDYQTIASDTASFQTVKLQLGLPSNVIKRLFQRWLATIDTNFSKRSELKKHDRYWNKDKFRLLRPELILLGCSHTHHSFNV